MDSSTLWERMKMPKIAAELGGIEGKPKIVKEYKRRTWFDVLTEDAFSDLEAIRDELFHQPIVQYKFTSPY